MKRRGKIILFLLLGVAIISSLIAWRMREPRYQGRTLTSWLKQCDDTATDDATDEKRPLTEAQLAIRAIGAEKVLPYSMRMIRAQDGPMKSWMITQSEKLEGFDFKFKRAEDIQRLGIAGFYGLGTNAAPAVPELARLLNDTNHAFIAVACLIFIGEPAQKSVCQALTNSDLHVRQLSVLQLDRVIGDAEIYLRQIKGCLNDPAEEVRFAAVRGIGAHTNASGSAIPLLLTALEDSSSTVSALAVEFLGDFGTNELRAFGALTDVAENGKPNTARVALRTLVKIAPREALPMVLERLRSDDPGRRRQSLLLLCKYPLKAPEIQAAIKGATADTDSVVSRWAKEFLTKQQGELRGNQPLFPGEPVYAGKTLGEWLKETNKRGRRGRKIDGLFTKEAEEAIRQMGTNAIPALLQRLVYVQPPYGLKAPEVNMEAVMAFITLRELARPARPQLMDLMDSKDEDTALHAMLASFGMGVDALPCAFKGLTNKHMMVRSEAANFLEQGQDAEFKLKRKEAVPVLLSLLNDPDEGVREVAGSTLKVIDPEAAARAGVR
ncbi:HEAT repeat domain-containing protein [Pedosphaera parvula]|uniref:HEAT domain containing protein n=1 Tax=Pedosphaera parvula (strain Ellin514) TaxID=320771 RepID=B9XS15_PEDPL|nr:HEAT repeat domain-containing protein [Pedosphaera parvula]EEF57386.1 HEAT domain containing protein [Pedosphaera parvula Ellin514]